ncbi:hypothetical protein [uncultured Pseudacidovorax sp.]|uniref:hypothetical protein n=1 Tax=uncultured Pseudacidovorax sp. TaxID=679313 RepID=UPI0025D16F59|nr:hypothetical protein [uncultured Pseudacidovorax sp.]
MLDHFAAPHPDLQNALFCYATGYDGASAVLIRGWPALVAQVEREVARGDTPWSELLADLDYWTNDGRDVPYCYSESFEDGYMSIYRISEAAATTAGEPTDTQDPWCMSCGRPRSAVCLGGGAWAWGDQADPWGLCSDCVVAARNLLATSRRLEARGFFDNLDNTDPQTARDAKEMRDALALAAPLEPPGQVDTTSREQYKRMFHSACIALGEVGEALGLHPEAASPNELLTAIQRLKANQKKRRGQTAPAEGGAAC